MGVVARVRGATRGKIVVYSKKQCSCFIRQAFGSHIKNLNSALPFDCRAPRDLSHDAGTIVTAPEILYYVTKNQKSFVDRQIDYRFPNVRVGKLIPFVQIQNIMSAHYVLMFYKITMQGRGTEDMWDSGELYVMSPAPQLTVCTGQTGEDERERKEALDTVVKARGRRNEWLWLKV